MPSAVEYNVLSDNPFFAECRAYGAIKTYQQQSQSEQKAHSEQQNQSQQKRQSRRKDKGGVQGPKRRLGRTKADWRAKELAVPCYGYLGLPANIYEQTLEDHFGIRDWNRAEEDIEREPSERQPFRALVKKLVDSPKAIVRPDKMLKDLKKLRCIPVFQRDMYARNYKDGMLVDFSMAWAEPHWHMSMIKGGQLILEKNSELYLFDEMIADAGIKTTVRATKDHKSCRKLRSSGVAVKETGLS
ncbi:MAG: hypothetical protein Q9160_009342 [Pyrenula sp. 1 TL-2023]